MTKVQQPLKWHGPLPTESVPVAGFPGYRVWPDSRVETCWRSGGRGKSFYQSGRWVALKVDRDDRGRQRVTLCRDGRPYKFRVSRLVLEAFVGPPPEGMEACHEDGNESADALDNLRWDTHSGNLLDKRRHGTMTNGENHPRAKLTAAAVLEMRRVGKPLKQHADRYGVSQTLVSLVLKRRIWQHV